MQNNSRTIIANKRKIFFIMLICLLACFFAFMSTANALTELTAEERANDKILFDLIDSRNPKSEKTVWFYNPSTGKTGHTHCNVSAITTLLNRRLAADGSSVSFTIKDVLSSFGCTQLKSCGENSSHTHQYWYWKDQRESTGNWYVNGRKYSKDGVTYKITRWTKSKVSQEGGNANNILAFIARMLHDHPEGVAARIYHDNSAHVIVFYRYEYNNGNYTLYIKENVGNKSGPFFSTFNSRKTINTAAKIYNNLDSIVFINGRTTLNPASPKSLTINETVASLNLSNTLNLSVVSYPSGTSNSVTWESSDSSVASVSTNGVVTPHKAGYSVTITARSTSDTNVTASCLVTTYYQQESGTLKFTGIKYPHTYVKNKAISWSGKVESDVDLESIVINLYTATNKYTQNASISSGCKSYEMKSFGDALFKKLSAGKFTFELIATDVMGRKLAFENNQCVAETSGDHVYYDAPGTYSRPELKGSAERNGHRYEVYQSGARIWDYDRDFAIEKGGHLVTISDAEENQFVCDLVVASGGTYAYTGGYYDSGWRWVDGSPFNYTAWRSDVAADSDIIYSAVAGLAKASQYTWGKASNTEMMNFVVEYDPIQVSSIVLDGTDNMTVDETQILPTTILPEEAYNQDIVYTSSDPSIATVNATTGLVTAMSEGNVTIYATAQDGSGVVGQFTLFVMHKPIPVTGLSVQANGDLYIDSKKIRLFEGEEASLQITITPLNADDKGVYFESDNTDIADFEPYSNDVTAISAGTCRLWCYTSNDQFSDYIDIEVAPLSGECGDNLTWAYEDRTLTISGTGAMYNYENRYSTPWFPLTDSVDIIAIGNEVSSIGDNAFSHFNNVTSIAIPSSITSIGTYAFGKCENLTSVGFVEGSQLRTIGESAFANCGIEEMLLPLQVSTIGKWAFYNCSNMSVLSIPGVASTGEAAFANCSSLTSVWIEEGTTEIGNNSFRNCSNLTYFYMPGTLTRIGDYAFDGCGNLTTLYVEGRSVSIGTSAIPQNANLTLHGFIGSTIQSYATANEISFQPLMNNPDFVLPSRLNTIEEEAFSGINASMIFIPDGATSIGEKAFRNCINLQEIRIPESVQSIADNAFEGCRNDLYIYSTEGSSAYNHVIRNGHIFVEEQYAIPRNGIVLNSN